MATALLGVSIDRTLSFPDCFNMDDETIFDIDQCCEAFDDGFFESCATTCQQCETHGFMLDAACDCNCVSANSSSCGFSPVLRDCMWSATCGLVPLIVPINSPSNAASMPGKTADTAAGRVGPDDGVHLANSCSICTSFVDYASMCVDTKTVFPYPVVATGPVVTRDCNEENSVSVTVETTTTLPCSVSYNHDSETSAYSSAVSDDELEEVDVVSVASCKGESNYGYASLSPLSADHSTQFNVRRQMLVLPGSKSISAQVAAMHNYSSTRCRPAPAVTMMNTSAHSLITKRCAKRLVGKAASRKRRRPVVTTSSGSDSSEDSWATGGDDDRCRRAQHNVMERRRRHHLKGNFFRLRDVIPEINGDSRVSKVAILCRARDHIERLSSNDRKLALEYDRLRAIQSRLKWKLSLLQRDQRTSTVNSN